MQRVEKLIGVSPSGKATDSDSVIREFKSLHPSQKKQFDFCRVAFLLCAEFVERFDGGEKPLGRFCLLTDVYFIVMPYSKLNSPVGCLAGRRAKRQISPPQPKMHYFLLFCA